MERASLDTSILLHHFQSRSGMLNHTGRTSAHSGMMDYLRIPIAEVHLGKCPDSMEFQSWKVNFRTEVLSKNSRSSDHHALDQRS